jgi:DeoR/GlpR family transcriptional regulator of sugar metabolism
MLNIERLDYIIKELKENNIVYVDQLASKHYVSKSTIRRDLTHLENEGLIRRAYGGAVLSNQVNNESPFFMRKNENHLAKDTIASIAARFVKDDMFISLDSSSTAMHIVKYLLPKNNLRIITTSAQTALNCLDTINAQVYCTGGWMHAYSRGSIGEAARQSIDGFYTNLLFFSARAISMEHGIMDINEEEIVLRKWMLKQCKNSILLCDSSKFDQVSFKRVCDFSDINYIITEKRPDEKWLNFFEQVNVRVIYPGLKLAP